MRLSISSSAFHEGDKIPRKYTCEGEDVSPELAWNKPPEDTMSLALLVEDPDAPGGVFTHWILFNIPAGIMMLPQGMPTQSQFPDVSLQGKNDFGKVGYSGPCPPPGRPHRYQFTLYALDRPLNLKPGVGKKQIVDAMRGHILAQGQITGIYQR
jgi:Raf kinase inhibitor-like YbhB/YbcL family protein